MAEDPDGDCSGNDHGDGEQHLALEKLELAGSSFSPLEKDILALIGESDLLTGP